MLARAAAGLLLLVVALAAAPAQAQVIMAMVNGDPVTAFDVDQRMKLVKLTEHKVLTQKEALEVLINERAKLKEGKRFGLELSKSDVDEQFDTMAKRMKIPTSQLEKALEQQGIRPESLKVRIKADYIWQQLVRGRFTQSLLVGEKEIQTAMNANGEAKPDDGNSFEYSMRPVVLLVDQERRDLLGREPPQGSGGAARPHPDLRRGQGDLSQPARRGDPRSRAENLGRHPAVAARRARRHADRPPHRTRGDPARRRDGGALRQEADHDRLAAEARYA